MSHHTSLHQNVAKILTNIYSCCKALHLKTFTEVLGMSLHTASHDYCAVSIFNSFHFQRHIPRSIYLIEVNNRNTRKSYKICSKLSIKINWRRSDVFIVNFDRCHTLLWCFYCYFEQVNVGLLITPLKLYLNTNIPRFHWIVQSP